VWTNALQKIQKIVKLRQEIGHQRAVIRNLWMKKVDAEEVMEPGSKKIALTLVTNAETDHLKWVAMTTVVPKRNMY